MLNLNHQGWLNLLYIQPLLVSHTTEFVICISIYSRDFAPSQDFQFGVSPVNYSDSVKALPGFMFYVFDTKKIYLKDENKKIKEALFNVAFETDNRNSIEL